MHRFHDNVSSNCQTHRIPDIYNSLLKISFALKFYYNVELAGGVYLLERNGTKIAVIIIIIIIIITSTSDLQPSTPTMHQLPGQLVSTEIRTMYKYKF